jgi:hypothetical protein
VHCEVWRRSSYAAPTELDACFGTDNYKDCAPTELVRLRVSGSSTVRRSLSCSDLAQRALLPGYGRQDRFRPGMHWLFGPCNLFHG